MDTRRLRVLRTDERARRQGLRHLPLRLEDLRAHVVLREQRGVLPRAGFTRWEMGVAREGDHDERFRRVCLERGNKADDPHIAASGRGRLLTNRLRSVLDSPVFRNERFRRIRAAAELRARWWTTGRRRKGRLGHRLKRVLAWWKVPGNDREQGRTARNSD